jgi:hypothetical protein
VTDGHGVVQRHFPRRPDDAVPIGLNLLEDGLMRLDERLRASLVDSGCHGGSGQRMDVHPPALRNAAPQEKRSGPIDVMVFVLLLVPDGHRLPGFACMRAKRGVHFSIQWTDRIVRWKSRPDRGDKLRVDLLQDDIIDGQGFLPFDLLQTHFNLDQLALHLGKLLADLCVTQAEHATHLLRR